MYTRPEGANVLFLNAFPLARRLLGGLNSIAELRRAFWIMEKICLGHRNPDTIRLLGVA
jgi:hypothetical protein